MYNQPSQLLDSDADNKVVDADLALQVLGGDHVAFGHLTTTITVTDTDRGRVEDKVRQVERIVNGLGFTTIREGVNAVEAWLSSLPGQTYANVRQPLIHTLNLAHLMPLSSVWQGRFAMPISMARRCFTRARLDRRRFACRPTSAMSGTCSWLGRPALASRCCSR